LREFSSVALLDHHAHDDTMPLIMRQLRNRKGGLRRRYCLSRLRVPPQRIEVDPLISLVHLHPPMIGNRSDAVGVCLAQRLCHGGDRGGDRLRYLRVLLGDIFSDAAGFGQWPGGGWRAKSSCGNAKFAGKHLPTASSGS